MVLEADPNGTRKAATANLPPPKSNGKGARYPPSNRALPDSEQKEIVAESNGGRFPQIVFFFR